MRNILLKTLIVALLLSSCGDDDNGDNSFLFSGTITGETFTFCVNDGTPDNVSGIALGADTSSGSNSTWIITDNDNTILSLPATIADVEANNFDLGEQGVQFIWFLSANGTVTNLEVGQDIASLDGDFDLSQTPIRVNRNATVAATLTGGPYTFCIDDNSDFILGGISIAEDDASGTSNTYLITDMSGEIIATPETIGDVEEFDFNEGTAGDLLVWNIRFEDNLTNNLDVGNNVSAIDGCFALSNSITVSRSVSDISAATISGGPYSFCIDDNADNVTGLSIDETEAIGTNSSWIVSTGSGTILRLLTTAAEIEAIDFDSDGDGNRIISNIRFEDGLVGLEVDGNTNNLIGCFALSNEIVVQRTESDNNAGAITADPFAFTIDGTPDFVSEIEVDDTDLSGSVIGWVITDNAGVIIALPETTEDLEAFNFDNVDVFAGTDFFISRISYETSIIGLEVFNNLTDLSGCFNISNTIQVTVN